MTLTIDRKQCQLFARLLEYPMPGIENLVQQAILTVRLLHPDAMGMLADFLGFVEQESLSKLGEVYTSTFDLQGVCHPYVGHHLFRESYQRSWFMARLNREYRLWGYTPGRELPDHVSVVLGFLALGNQDEFSQTLLEEGLKPALQKMVEEIKSNANNPYCQLIQAINLVVGGMGNSRSHDSDVSTMQEVDHA